MKVEDLFWELEVLCPRKWAEGGDFYGPFVFLEGEEVSGLLVCLNLTERAVREARRRGLNCVLVHHPPARGGVERFYGSSPLTRALSACFSGKVSAFVLHTAWDRAPGGQPQALCEALGVKFVCSLEKDLEGGYGALGEFEEPVPFEELLALVGRRWGASWYALVGERPRSVRKLALVGGSGGAFWREARELGADLFVTCDVRYHQAMEALGNLPILELDHGEMERASLPGLVERIRSFVPGLRVELWEDEPVSPYGELGRI